MTARQPMKNHIIVVIVSQSTHTDSVSNREQSRLTNYRLHLFFPITASSKHSAESHPSKGLEYACDITTIIEQLNQSN